MTFRASCRDLVGAPWGRGRGSGVRAGQAGTDNLGQTAHVLATLMVAQLPEIAQGGPGTWQAKRHGSCGLPRPGVHPAPPPGNRPV